MCWWLDASARRSESRAWGPPELKMAVRKRKTISEYIAERRGRDADFAEEFDKLQLARQMKDLREKAGLSQAELAARIGTQAPGIARLESGRFAPRLDVLHRIAAALGKRVRIQFDPARPQASGHGTK